MNPMSPTDLTDQLAKLGQITFPVKIIPKSEGNAIVGMMTNGALKIRIKAPADKNKANEELVRFLAEDFETTKDKVEIISGKTDPHKLVRLKK